MHDKYGTYDDTAGNFAHGHPFAGPMSFQYGNGQSFNMSRDQDYRPATLADGPYQKTYSHDPAGNVASLTDIGNTVLSYSYDRRESKGPGIKGARLDLFPYPL